MYPQQPGITPDRILAGQVSVSSCPTAVGMQVVGGRRHRRNAEPAECQAILQPEAKLRKPAPAADGGSSAVQLLLTHAAAPLRSGLAGCQLAPL